MKKEDFNFALQQKTTLSQIITLREFLVIDLENCEYEEDFEQCIEILDSIKRATAIIDQHLASLQHKKTNSENEKD